MHSAVDGDASIVQPATAGDHRCKRVKLATYADLPVDVTDVSLAKPTTMGMSRTRLRHEQKRLNGVEGNPVSVPKWMCRVRSGACSSPRASSRAIDGGGCAPAASEGRAVPTVDSGDNAGPRRQRGAAAACGRYRWRESQLVDVTTSM
jgi:hypothetical protein